MPPYRRCKINIVFLLCSYITFSKCERDVNILKCLLKIKIKLFKRI